MEKFFAKPMFSKKTRSSKPLAVYVGFYSKKLAAGGTHLPRILKSRGVEVDGEGGLALAVSAEIDKKL